MRTRLHAAFASHVAVSAALAAVFAVLVIALAPLATAAPAAGPWQGSAAGVVLAQAQGQTDEPGTEATAPPGPRIEPAESAQADEQEAQRKAVMAAVAAALLVIVILGRRARNKSKPGKNG